MLIVCFKNLKVDFPLYQMAIINVYVDGVHSVIAQLSVIPSRTQSLTHDGQPIEVIFFFF